MKNSKSYARGSNIARHHLAASNPSIDFKNSPVIDKGSFRVRKTLAHRLNQLYREKFKAAT